VSKISTKTPTIMFQGTGSSVGKSVIVAGLCRLFTRKGISVAPFKPQNMSNNAAATFDGGEIGRAQALQALASRMEPSILNNPILLKPQSESRSQLIINGKLSKSVTGYEYQKLKGSLMSHVEEAYHKLAKNHQLILVEGAGSPAEINLRNGDIANMGFATKLSIPTVMIGDIDRGGVIASLVGTKVVLDDIDRDNIVGFIINKFRGDPSLFDNGIDEIKNRTKWQFLGLIPFYENISKLPAEDSHDLDKILYNKSQKEAVLNIAIPILSKISNFDDIDPLRVQKNINIHYVRPGDSFPKKIHIILLLGSKSTINDLEELRSNGWDKEIYDHSNNDGIVIGLCGGYQMLGQAIRDPKKLESTRSTTKGLGLLDVETEMSHEKIVTKINGTHIQTNNKVYGYEIHIGKTLGEDCNRPLFNINNKYDGATSKNNKVFGTYVHGIFHNKQLIEWLFKICGKTIKNTDIIDYQDTLEKSLDDLSDHLESYVNWKTILELSKKNINDSNQYE
tara:strand:- start:390 stop:1910 length:1521 start_codon:yes stop_codon:yes gene_type:complete